MSRHTLPRALAAVTCAAVLGLGAPAADAVGPDHQAVLHVSSNAASDAARSGALQANKVNPTHPVEGTNGGKWGLAGLTGLFGLFGYRAVRQHRDRDRERGTRR